MWYEKRLSQWCQWGNTGKLGNCGKPLRAPQLPAPSSGHWPRAPGRVSGSLVHRISGNEPKTNAECSHRNFQSKLAWGSEAALPSFIQRNIQCIKDGASKQNFFAPWFNFMIKYFRSFLKSIGHYNSSKTNHSSQNLPPFQQLKPWLTQNASPMIGSFKNM